MSAFCNFANMTTTRTTSSAAAATNTKTSAVTKATSAAMLGFKKSIDFGKQFRSLATLTAINLYVYEVCHYVQPYDVVKVSAKLTEEKMQNMISGRLRFRMSGVSMLFAIILIDF